MTAVRHNPSKWAQRSAAAGQDYVNGAAQPRRSWATAAAAAETNYTAGVTEAAAQGRFARGIQKAGDNAWKRGIDEKGRTRFQQGVSVSQDNYAQGFEPFKRVIESTTLPPRGPKGQNYGRVQAIGDALRQAKVNG